MKKTVWNNIMLWIGPAIFVLVFSFRASAVDISLGDSAYLNGDYKKAVEIYSEALIENGISANLLYNLGNAYYKEGNDGDAMICYERAKRMDPSNKEINKNLIFLKTKVTDANRAELKGKDGNVSADEESFLDSIYNVIAVETRSNSWAVMAIMAFLLFLGGFGLYIFNTNVMARKTGFFGGLIFFCFAVIFVVFSFMSASYYNKHDEGILTVYTTELLERHEIGANTVSIPLHRGTKLKILETYKGNDGNEWIKVKLNTDNIGWIKKSDLEII